MNTQIVIVGAGPTGATLALLLAKRGIAVKLIEASHNFRRIFRGEGLMPSGLDALEEMGLSSILKHIPHRSLDAWEFFIKNQLLFRVNEPIEVGGKSPMLVSQPAFLQALIEEAKTYSHFEFVQSVPVHDLLWKDQRVCGVKLSDEDSIYADLVVGADGRNSIVRQRANLPIKQYSETFNILWFKLSNSPHFRFENVFYLIVNGDHTFSLFQSSEGNIQIGWVLDENITEWKQIDWYKKFVSVSPPWLVGLGLTLWSGTFEDQPGIWLRWCDQQGQVILTGAELSILEKQRADNEKQKASRLAEKLREMGIDPDTL